MTLSLGTQPNRQVLFSLSVPTHRACGRSQPSTVTEGFLTEMSLYHMLSVEKGNRTRVFVRPNLVPKLKHVAYFAKVSKYLSCVKVTNLPKCLFCLNVTKSTTKRKKINKKGIIAPGHNCMICGFNIPLCGMRRSVRKCRLCESSMGFLLKEKKKLSDRKPFLIY